MADVAHFHSAAAGIDHLERLAAGESPVHRLSAGAKLAVTLVFIGALVSVPPGKLSALVPFFFYPALLAALSGTPWRPLLSRFAAAAPFVGFVAASNLLLMREAAFVIGPFTVTTGLLAAVSLLVKTFLSVSAVLLLIATTPFVNIAALLTRTAALRPAGLQIILTYRYISTLTGEAGDMWTAYHLRSPGSRAVKMRDMGSFLGQLLLRSFDKAETVYAAMKCRGFSGAYPTLPSNKMVSHRDTVRDIVFVGLSVALFAVFRFFPVSHLLGAAVFHA